MATDTLAELRWNGAQEFDATSGAQSLTLDGEGIAGASPMQHLAFALGGCMGIDIAHVLEKMRTPPTALSLRLVGTRAVEPPRRFVEVRLIITVEGDVPRANLDRAVTLSRERYCSVWHSMSRDIRLEIDARISPPQPA